MFRATRCMIMVGLAAAAALGAGCTWRPVLSVTPVTVALGNGVSDGTFRVANTGGGALRVTVSEDLPWVALRAPSGETVSPYTATVRQDVLVLQVVLVEDGIPEGELEVRGEIRISSNAGEETVIVSARRETEAVLNVTPETLDFGLNALEQTVTVTNRGSAALNWTLGIPANQVWLGATPVAGTLAFGERAEVTVRVNRGNLAASAEPYSAPLQFVSNGGNAQVTATMQVPTFSVSPPALDFGALSENTTRTQGIVVQNRSAGPIPLQISAVTTDGAGWLAVGDTAPVLPASTSLQVPVSASSAGLQPGTYTGTIRVAAPSLDFSLEIAVSALVQAFRLAPVSVDFGTITEPATRTVTVENLGQSPLDWSASIPPVAAGWLAADPASGTVPGAGTVTLTLTATPGAVASGSYTAAVSVDVAGVVTQVAAAMTRPKPAELKVSPSEVDFGVSGTEVTVGIWNEGIGTITWGIDTTAFPAWLSLAPVDGAGQAGGTVSGDLTDTVTLRVDRTLAPEGQDIFEHAFQVTAAGDSTTAVPVVVRASAPKLPEFAVVGEGVDVNNIPFLLFDIQETTQTFVIQNTGYGRLSWRVDENQTIPNWVTSISPLQGEVEPGRQATITVTVNREGLPRTGAVYALQLASNDPARPLALLELQVRVPYTITIGVKPESIAFGRFANTAIVEVCNQGDPGEYLNFQIVSNQPDWLFVDPGFGRSLGSPAGIPKDWRPISVAIDRSKIPGTGASAKLTVSATEVPTDAIPPEPVEITVSVDLAPLTIQGAVPTLRCPSLIRANFLLRDSAYTIFPKLLDDPADALFHYDLANVDAVVLEDSLPLDLDETEVYVRKNEGLRFTVLIMMDFSGSMKAAAEKLVEDGDLPGGLADPLLELYRRTIGPLIAALPGHYRVALGVFSERDQSQPLRLIYGADAANPGLANEPFVKNKDVLQYRLDTITVVDNGATALLPAITSAASTLFLLDSDEILVPFDASEEYVAVAVTDGRRTTPPGETGPVGDFLEGTRVRLMPIGWGTDVQANPLIELASQSGGHYYAAESRMTETGEKRPTLSGLLKRCGVEAGFETQSLPRDLQAHFSFGYVSLNEAASVLLDARITSYDKNPEVTGDYFVEQVPTGTYANDVRLGQIGMKSEGISGGSAVVRLYADYMPRNLSRLSLRVSAEQLDGTPLPAPAYAVVPKEGGGLVSDWTLQVVNNDYTFEAPAGRAFRYGDYGELMDITVDSAVPFKVRLEVLDPLIGGSQDGKYFTSPDTITVGDTFFQATSFPRPRLGYDPAPVFTKPDVVDLGAAGLQADVDVFNIGGSHPPTDVALHWVIRQGALSWPGRQTGSFTIDPIDAELIPPVTSTEIPGLCVIAPDREAAEPGLYSGSFYMDFTYGSLPYFGTLGPFYVLYAVEPPKMEIENADLDFGDAATELPAKVTNTGQGLLEWSIDTADLPEWVSVTSAGSVLGPGQEAPFNVRVDRSVVGPGTYVKNIQVRGNTGLTDMIHVRMVKN
ncbi:MAG: hypothetical protein GXY15_10455 [Candidatus Hydrogenedentes bacterium]|nr:hypothetical protein [Candidatus Hydrogenedentota bacterium]